MKKDIAVRYETEKGEVALTIDMVRSFLVSGKPEMVSDSEIVMFLNLAKYQKLNPFLREIYLVKWADSQPANMVVGKDVFTKRAFHNPRFKGMECGIIVISNNQVQFRKGTFMTPKEQLVGGYAKVYVEGWEIPLEHTVSLDEYNTYKSLWRQKPATMIRKVALVQALREAFPDDFQGLYDQSEMPLEHELPTDEIKVSEPTQDCEYEEVSEFITKEQATELWRGFENKEILKKALDALGYPRLGEIPASDYQEILEELRNIYEQLSEESAEGTEEEIIDEPVEESEAVEEATGEEVVEEVVVERENAKANKPITVHQATVIMGLAEGHENISKEVLAKYGYDKAMDVLESDFQAVCKEIDQRVQEVKKGKI